MNQQIQTEDDLKGLIGHYETIRQDFKSSRLFEQEKSKLKDALSCEVSAFANTEGGVLVIGIETGKDAEKAMAIELSDGIDPKIIQPEWLQRVVASNISPPLNGLIVRPIPLSGTRAGKVAYVIEIPKGDTAYQAMDLKYYGRHELESKPLADNEIRLRMNRGRVAHATVEILTLTRLSADEELKRREEQRAKIVAEESETDPLELGTRRCLAAEKAKLEGPKRSFDEHTVELAIRNDGPMSICDCSLSIAVITDSDVAFVPQSDGSRWMFHFLPESAIRETHTSVGGGKTTEYVPIRERKLFPEQMMPFPDAKLTMRIPPGVNPAECSLKWVLYLEDAPSVSGVIDLAKVLTPSC